MDLDLPLAKDRGDTGGIFDGISFSCNANGGYWHSVVAQCKKQMSGKLREQRSY